MPISPILSSVAFTVYISFYLYFVGSFFKINIYPLINRVTFYTVFEEYIINQHIDYIIIIIATASWFLLSVNNRAIRYYFSIAYGAGITLALISPDAIVLDIITLVSLPLISSVMLYYYYRKRQKNVLNFNAKLTLRYISLAVIAISAIGIVLPVLDVFVIPNFDYSTEEEFGALWDARDPANQLFYLLSSFSNVYIFLLAFCLGLKVLYREVLRTLKINPKEDIPQKFSDAYEEKRLKTQTKIGFLVLAMILSVVLVLIPQHPLINRDNQQIGDDSETYVAWIGDLAESKNVSDVVYQSFVSQGSVVYQDFVSPGSTGDRPLSLILLFLFYQVAGANNISVVEHFPMILGPGTVLAFYFLTKELTRNEEIALIAAFLGGLSLHTLMGIYGGLYSNWLGLIVGYISIAFLFRYLRSGRLSDIVVFSILFIGALFSHVYSWTILAGVSGIFLVVMLLVVIWNNFKRKKNQKRDSNNGNISNHFTKRRVIWPLVAILLCVAVDIARVALTNSSGGIEQDIQIAGSKFGLEQFNKRWNTLQDVVQKNFGGVLGNFIILIPALFWVLKSNMREPSNIFLMIFLSAGLLPLYIGSWILQTRVFYETPFEIPAAIALYYISTRVAASKLVTVAACTWLVAVSLVTVMNYFEAGA
jgi:hypothetical protein